MSIDEYEFKGDNIVGAGPINDKGEIPFYIMGNSGVTLTKKDVIRLAIEMKLTANDI